VSGSGSPTPACCSSLTRRRLLLLYKTLRDDHGELHWWPGRTRFEIIAGAILTQNTGWRNVEKAITALRDHTWLRVDVMRTLPELKLAEAIRASGYFRQKARKLKAFLRYLDARHGGRLARMAHAHTDSLRADLLGIWEIGPETADSILLYAFNRPVFVVDAYTHRILHRHALHPGGGYEEVRCFLEENLPRRIGLYNDFHAQLVWVGHRFCRADPRCDSCPLACLLPKGGARPGSPARYRFGDPVPRRARRGHVLRRAGRTG